MKVIIKGVEEPPKGKLQAIMDEVAARIPEGMLPDKEYLRYRDELIRVFLTQKPPWGAEIVIEGGFVPAPPLDFIEVNIS